jgi:hypothetical protein
MSTRQSELLSDYNDRAATAVAAPREHPAVGGWTFAVETQGVGGGNATDASATPAAGEWAAWHDSAEVMAIRMSAAGSPPAHRRMRSIAELQAFRPDMIVVRGFGYQTLPMLVQAQWKGRAAIVLWADAPSGPGLPPRTGLGVADRLILKLADAVVCSTGAMASAVARRGVPVERIFTLTEPHDIAAFLTAPVARPEAVAHRLIHVGALTPQAGVADFQNGIANWADAHRDGTVEICWAGEGNLRRVLEAQPLPDNVVQRFLHPLDEASRADAFAQSGLLVLPSLRDDWDARHGQVVAEAMAAGLPVLGSSRCHDVVHWVREDVTGWLFDPFSPESMLRSLDVALQTSPATLDDMRQACRALCMERSAPGGPGGVAGQMTKLLAEILRSSKPSVGMLTEVQA